MGLKAKFNIVMAVAFMIGLGLAAFLANQALRDGGREQVRRDASMIMAQAQAVRGYTATEVEPLLREQMKARFLPHSVPSWSAQTVWRSMQKQFPDYSYKEAALNPTNPADRATDWEADIINRFRDDPKLTEVVTTRDTATGPVLVYAKPLRITNAACLLCHTTAKEAPQTMVDLYGPNNGFGWKLNEAIGAQVATVPLAVVDKRAGELLMSYVGALAAVFAVVIVLLNIMLHYIVVKPVRQMSLAANDISLGNMDAPEVEVKGRDEIASLAESFNRMRRSLANAMKMLGS
jgi:HAMP domain-containing protein